MIEDAYLISYYDNNSKSFHNSMQYGANKRDVVISFNKNHRNSAILNIIEL
jgi:hypothetical protein